MHEFTKTKYFCLFELKSLCKFKKLKHFFWNKDDGKDPPKETYYLIKVGEFRYSIKKVEIKITF